MVKVAVSIKGDPLMTRVTGTARCFSVVAALSPGGRKRPLTLSPVAVRLWRLPDNAAKACVAGQFCAGVSGQPLSAGRRDYRRGTGMKRFILYLADPVMCGGFDATHR